MENLRLQVFGHIGNDAEVNFYQNYKIINFSVAATKKWKDTNGELKERTEWVRCAIWLEQGDKSTLPDYLKKGQMVYAEGFPSINIYTSEKAGGRPAATFEMRVEKRDVKLLGKRPEGQAQPAAAMAATSGGTFTMDEADNDLPF